MWHICLPATHMRPPPKPFLQETAAACKVNCMPTFQFFVNGEKVDEMSGADEAGLKTKIESNIRK
jgi:hypothetical protein